MKMIMFIASKFYLQLEHYLLFFWSNITYIIYLFLNISYFSKSLYTRFEIIFVNVMGIFSYKLPKRKFNSMIILKSR